MIGCLFGCLYWVKKCIISRFWEIFQKPPGGSSEPPGGSYPFVQLWVPGEGTA